jgi:hypothetical protein
MGSLQGFLRERRVTDSARASHVSLAGGKYAIGTAERDELYRWMAQDTEGYYLVERVHYPSRFFIDLDGCEVSYPVLEKLCTEIRWGAYLICRSSRKKNNYHIIFSEQMVDSPWMAKVRCKVWSQHSELLSRSVDRSVYHTGLRMLGAYKDKRRDNQYFAMSYGGQITSALLRRASIHVQEPTIPTPVLWRGEPRVRGAVCDDTDGYDFSRIHTRYSAVRATKLTRPTYWLMYMETKERWCGNYEGDHKSATVWFELNLKKKEVRQRCHCRCATKTCSTFKSPWTKLRVEDYYALKKVLK